jgi:hypothetical protein
MNMSRALDPNAVQCGAAGFDWGEDSFMLYCVYYGDCDILKYQIDYTCAASGSDSSSESREARRATYVRKLTKYSYVDAQRQYEHQLRTGQIKDDCPCIYDIFEALQRTTRSQTITNKEGGGYVARIKCLYLKNTGGSVADELQVEKDLGRNVPALGSDGADVAAMEGIHRNVDHALKKLIWHMNNDPVPYGWENMSLYDALHGPRH